MEMNNPNQIHYGHHLIVPSEGGISVDELLTRQSTSFRIDFKAIEENRHVHV